jgi:hypothetical protein
MGGGGEGRRKLGRKPLTPMAVLGNDEGDDDDDFEFDLEDEPRKQPAAAK